MSASVDYVRNGLVVCPTGCGAPFRELVGDPFPAVRCKKCGLGIEKYVALNPKAYEFDTYSAARDAGTGANAWLRWHHDVAVATLRLEQLAPYLPVRNDRDAAVWVDVGCASGAFLTAAARAGWGGIGIDVAPIDMPFWTMPFDKWVCDRDGLDGHGTRVVSFFDSLEHMPDPTIAIRTAARDLAAPGSVLVIEAPDLDAAADFATWKHRRINHMFTEHIWHFSESSLTAMVNRYAPKLEPVAVRRPIEGRLQVVWRVK